MTETANTLWLDQMFEPGELAGFAEGVSGQLQKDIQPKFKIALPHLLAPEIANKLSAGLHIDVLAFLAEGWYAALELDECRKQSLAAPTSSVIAKLGRHIVSRELKPNIVGTYGARQAFDVDAAVVLAGVFEGIELAFEKGRLVSRVLGNANLPRN